MDKARVQLEIEGIVQGVGFRPFIYGLALDYGLRGLVRNQPSGVLVDLEGDWNKIESFIQTVRRRHPPLAKIESVRPTNLPAIGYEEFKITETSGRPGATQVPADQATCSDCLREMADPGDRRYRYPFINCTNCGPRFTIIEKMPYDRESTTMRSFQMCPRCLEEYHDPGSRRFHAQPNACPLCGPRLFLLDGLGRPGSGDPLTGAVKALNDGGIVALKGLGGCHLACDARSALAVARLRRLKARADKPFAVMCRDLQAVKSHCLVSAFEEEMLSSGARPIVLLERLGGSPVTSLVAPGLERLGVMLPYTPLHHLLLAEGPDTLVMTSANLGGEPILIQNNRVLDCFRETVDAFLLHDRDIYSRADDSVGFVVSSSNQIAKPVIIRRSRGYAPAVLPLPLPLPCPDLLAVGAQQKNTLTLASGKKAFLSQHIGDLEGKEPLEAFEQSVTGLGRLFNIQPGLVVHDLHPGYTATRWAMESGLPCLAVQHHEAHLAACLADNGVSGDVIGVVWDGAGYGTDGHIWGGEFFTGRPGSFTRAAHLAYHPMPGGEAAVREPWRMAWSYLASAGLYPSTELLDKWQVEESRLAILRTMADRGLNCPLTSSAGRLFEAAGAVICGRAFNTYEGQAAVELEQAGRSYLKHKVNNTTGPAAPAMQLNEAIKYQGDKLAVMTDWILPYLLEAGILNRIQGTLAYLFHEIMSGLIEAVCVCLRDQTGLGKAALTGGVFQNGLLLELTAKKLTESGFSVVTHLRAPPNDGGISYGQAVLAACIKGG